MPKLDLVAQHPKDPLLPRETTKPPKELHIAWTGPTGQARSSTQPFSTPKVESFVVYGIDPGEITHALPAAPAPPP